jgi:isopenicillin N synthase-like dioxygenase
MSLRAFNLGEFQKGKAQQPLPGPLMRHEPEISHFESLCHDLCMKILRLFALGLKVRTWVYLWR